MQEMTSIFSTTSAGILVDYQGLTANEMSDLRSKLREVSSKMRVIKNKLSLIAAKETPYAGLSDQFVDTRALVYSADDPMGQAKVIVQFAKDNPNLKIFAGILVDRNKVSILDENSVEALESMPSREELLVQLLFLMQSPATQLVRTLNEVPAKFVRLLSAVAESKQ